MFDNILKTRNLDNIIRAGHEELQVFRVKESKIRLGNQNDGGYVVLNTPELKTAPQLISFGVGNDIGFEQSFLLNSEVDPEICIYDIVKPTIPLPAMFKFEVGNALNLKKLPIKKNAVLKMDVEGTEWVALSLAFDSKKLQLFSQIIVEFHFLHVQPPVDLSPYFTTVYLEHANAMNHLSFTYYLKTLRKINQDFTLYHIHANNSLPPVKIGALSVVPLFECSFIRTDLIKHRKPSKEVFPTEYDAPNKLDRPDYSNIQPPEKLC